MEATRENAAANGVEVDVTRVDLRRDALPAGEVVLANLLLPLLRDLAPRLPVVPRALVAGGLLVEQLDEAAGMFAPLVERERRTEGEWGVLLLTYA